VLLLSLITLFAGPLLFQWLSRSAHVARMVDRVIVVVLVVLVAVLLLPETIEPLGIAAPLFVIAGYLLPGVLEKLIRRAAETLHLVSLFVALLGLILHALLDGAGLAGSELRSSPALAAGIILHRFGVGLMLWLIIEPVFGRNLAWWTLVAIAASTIVGFEFSEWLLPLADDRVVSALLGVIVGTIIHGLIHRSHVHKSSE
jgi:hypothetical protein